MFTLDSFGLNQFAPDNELTNHITHVFCWLQRDAVLKKLQNIEQFTVWFWTEPTGARQPILWVEEVAVRWVVNQNDSFEISAKAW